MSCFISSLRRWILRFAVIRLSWSLIIYLFSYVTLIRRSIYLILFHLCSNWADIVSSVTDNSSIVMILELFLFCYWRLSKNDLLSKLSSLNLRCLASLNLWVFFNPSAITVECGSKLMRYWLFYDLLGLLWLSLSFYSPYS